MRTRLVLVLAATLAACGSDPTQSPATDASTAADSDASADWSGSYGGNIDAVGRDLAVPGVAVGAGPGGVEVTTITAGRIDLSRVMSGCSARLEYTGPNAARLTEARCTAASWRGPYLNAVLTLRTGALTRSGTRVTGTSEWGFEAQIAPDNPGAGMTQRATVTMTFDLTR